VKATHTHIYIYIYTYIYMYISLLLSNQLIPSQITDTIDGQLRYRQQLDPHSVLPVAQWTWHAHVVAGSGQTGRASGKCKFMISITLCTVHHILFRWSNFWPANDLSSPEALCSMQSVSYCGHSQPVLYTNRTDGRRTKAVCGFHKLIKQS